jgi:SAM-dependent methyltransferase
MQSACKLLHDSLPTFIYAVLSGPHTANPIKKIEIHPLLLKNMLYYQWTETRGNQVFHSNLLPDEFESLWEKHISAFKQGMLYTSEADYHILNSKKGRETILKKPPSRQSVHLVHNRPKDYLLAENVPLPFLVELGVMNATGKILPQKRDKFKQINRFLEMVDDVIAALDQTHPIHIVDFGCGKAYLTFALYYYLRVCKGMQLTMSGVDLKPDAIATCSALAKKLGYDTLHFVLGDINHYQSRQQVDMVVALHACDTATDAAIDKAVKWQAKVILCAPCCQHELLQQIANPLLNPLLKHGILKERFAALATDAARAQLLEAVGYRVQVLEFIDAEHTPKNMLIRAIKQQTKPNPEAWQAYIEFKKTLHIHPSLEVMLGEGIQEVK